MSEWLAAETPQQPAIYVPVIRAYLEAETGGDLGGAAVTPQQLETLAQAVATLYARMVAGDDILAMMQEMKNQNGSFTAGMKTTDRELLQ